MISLHTQGRVELGGPPTLASLGNWKCWTDILQRTVAGTEPHVY